MLITAIIGLSVAGFIIALYFTLMTFGRTSLAEAVVPPFCRVEAGTCATLLTTKEARIFGPSNALLGTWYYGLVALAGATGWLGQKSVGSFFLLLSWISVAVSIYLAYSLIQRLKARCTLCMASHAVNLLLSLLLFVKVKGL